MVVVAREVTLLASTLDRKIEIDVPWAPHARVTQVCPLCGARLAVWIDAEVATLAALHRALFPIYDEHRCVIATDAFTLFERAERAPRRRRRADRLDCRPGVARACRDRSRSDGRARGRASRQDLTSATELGRVTACRRRAASADSAPASSEAGSGMSGRCRRCRRHCRHLDAYLAALFHRSNRCLHPSRCRREFPSPDRCRYLPAQAAGSCRPGLPTRPTTRRPRERARRP